jgi:hypothetical protein
LLGFPRSTFCRKWKQATTASESAVVGAPSEFYEGSGSSKKSKRQSTGKAQTVYRRWPFRRIKMIDERLNSLLFSETEPITSSTIDGITELLTEKVLLMEPVFFEIDPSLSKYTSPPAAYPKAILESCKNDEPIDARAMIINLLGRVPQDIIATFPVPQLFDFTNDPNRSESQQSMKTSFSAPRTSLFDTGVTGNSMSMSMPGQPSFSTPAISSFPPTTRSSFHGMPSFSSSNLPGIPSNSISSGINDSLFDSFISSMDTQPDPAPSPTNSVDSTKSTSSSSNGLPPALSPSSQQPSSSLSYPPASLSIHPTALSTAPLPLNIAPSSILTTPHSFTNNS